MPDCQLGWLMTLIEGTQLDAPSSFHVVHELITEPTHLMEQPASYIDLIFTNQPNLVIDSGVYPSLHTNCNHQVVHCKLNLNIKFLLSYESFVWDYKKGDL